jgi:hypothetical protein
METGFEEERGGESPRKRIAREGEAPNCPWVALATGGEERGRKRVECLLEDGQRGLYSRMTGLVKLRGRTCPVEKEFLDLE